MGDEASPPDEAAGLAYHQPTPRWFYVHDDLTDEVHRRAGPGSPAATLAHELLELLRADRDRVTVLTLDDQLERVVRQGPFPRSTSPSASDARASAWLGSSMPAPGGFHGYAGSG